MGKKKRDCGQIFDRMVGMLEDGLIEKQPGISFRKLSGILCIASDKLDEFIREQVGISGAEVLDLYRDFY